MRTYKSIGLIILFVISLQIVSCSKTQETSDEIAIKADKNEKPKQPEETTLVSYPGRSIKYSEKFRDKNDSHLAAARKIGLNPGPKTRKDAEKMHSHLCLLHTNKNYIVEPLTHSVPYLVPVASKRLNAIGSEWADILSRNNLPHYRFRITSVLRTQEDIKNLQKHNSNAISNSPHNYATTFDLAYTKFDKVSYTHEYMTEDNLKLVLAQVLLNQQRDGHIYVKYEYKQSCFHITVIN